MFSTLQLGCFLSILVVCSTIRTVVASDTTYEGPTFVPEGSEFIIKCHTIKHKHPKWTRNGIPINVDETQKVTETSGIRQTVSYFVSSATTEHAGNYTCHEFSTVQHEIIILTGYVTNEPEPGKPFVVELWKPFALVCNVTTEPPQEDQMMIEWLKKDVLIVEEKNKFQIYKDNNTLLILNATEEDCETYTCRFNGSDNSTSHSFVVRSQPIIHPKLAKSINKVEGETLIIGCNAYGVPAPEVVWLRDEQNLNVSGNSRISIKQINHTLSMTITDLEEDDRALYTCRAKNEFGNFTSEILVRVKDKLAALWPFLGIVAEVAVLCTIIFIYEKRRAKQEFDESDTDQSPDTKNVTENKDKEVRQRK